MFPVNSHGIILAFSTQIHQVHSHGNLLLVSTQIFLAWIAFPVNGNPVIGSQLPKTIPFLFQFSTSSLTPVVQKGFAFCWKEALTLQQEVLNAGLWNTSYFFNSLRNHKGNWILFIAQNILFSLSVLNPCSRFRFLDSRFFLYVILFKLKSYFPDLVGSCRRGQLETLETYETWRFV